MKNKLSILKSTAPSEIILIRLMVGAIFLAEGIQKFLYPIELGSGRFERIGIPLPEVMGPFVGGVETVCGLFVLVGLFTRFAAIPLLVTITVALISTKVPILLGHGFWGFSLRELPRYGFLSMMHEARNDSCMFLGSLFLIIAGAGHWSVDAWIARNWSASYGSKNEK